jgi:hypothetical protein
LQGDYIGNITNNGTIKADTQAYSTSFQDYAYAYVNAYGISIFDDIDGDISNNEEITVNGQAMSDSDDYAAAYTRCLRYPH